jgi:hypothetical protein
LWEHLISKDTFVFNFLLGFLLWKKCWLTWSRRQWTSMFCQILHLQQLSLLIFLFKCLMVVWIFLFWLLIFWMKLECPYILLWGCLKWTWQLSNPMVMQFQSLLDRFDLLRWVIPFLKDKGINLTTMTTTLHTIINCEHFQGLWNYMFGHVMFKVY